MLRVIFDTNIYGLLVEEDNAEAIGETIANDKDFVIYGFKPIRKELRNTPRTLRLGKINQRKFLLEIYDKITKNRTLPDIQKIHMLALKFYKAYRKFGGIKNWGKSNISVDFTIIACACFYKLDIVVSDDCKTMLSRTARKAYKHIAIKESLWIPNFWNYSDLRKRYGF